MCATVLVSPNLLIALSFSSSYKFCILVAVVAHGGNTYMLSMDVIQIISSRPLSSTLLRVLQAVATHLAVLFECLLLVVTGISVINYVVWSVFWQGERGHGQQMLFEIRGTTVVT